MASTIGITTLITFLACRAALQSESPTAQPVSTPPAATEPHFLRVTTWTDVVTPVAGNKVMVTQNGLSRTFFTDGDGVGPEFRIETGSIAALTLKQRSVGEGLCLGQVYDYACADLGTNHPAYELLTLFQPLLEPVILDSGAPYFAQSPHHDRWAFTKNENSSYQFAANVGLLVTPREIEALRRYYQLQLEDRDYRLGLVIHVSDAEELGEEGTKLQMRLDTYGFTEAPNVDRYHVAFAAADLGAADFEVLPFHWEPAFGAGDVGYYDVFGTLGRGMNLLLFHAAEAAPLVEQIAVTPSFPPVAKTAGPAAQPLTAGSAFDCGPEGPKPPQPTGNESCALISPGDDPGCAISDCGEPKPRNCRTRWVPVGGPQESAGPVPFNPTFTVTITYTGSVSVDFKVNGVGVSTSQGVNTSTSESITMALGPGKHGCGQKAQAYKRSITCEKNCVVHRDQYLLGVFKIFSCVDTLDIATCADGQGTYVASCNKTGC